MSGGGCDNLSHPAVLILRLKYDIVRGRSVGDEDPRRGVIKTNAEGNIASFPQRGEGGDEILEGGRGETDNL